LIHADFSEYNLLWHEQTIYVIDVAQSVEPYHPNAFTYLLRDCTNLFTYFSRRTLNDYVLSPENTFNYVTGLEFDQKGSDFLNQVQTYEKNIRLQSEAVKEKENFSFEYFFNQTRQWQDDDSSSDDDENDDADDENYIDITSDDDYNLTKIATSKTTKTVLRKAKPLKH
jgi:RIO kinase 3